MQLTVCIGELCKWCVSPHTLAAVRVKLLTWIYIWMNNSAAEKRTEVAAEPWLKPPTVMVLHVLAKLKMGQKKRRRTCC